MSVKMNSNPNERYWLCCGSTKYPHGAESCLEATMGHTERVRFGTAKEHSDWQLKLKIRSHHVHQDDHRD